MIFRCHELAIELSSPDAAIVAGWQRLLAGWVSETAAAERPYSDIRLTLQLRDELPPPTGPLLFADSLARPANPAILSVFGTDEGAALLHFHQAAQVRAPLDGTMAAAGFMLRSALGNGRFEDVTYTSLAPLLRRHGYFLLHAFAAAKDGRAVLLVGASGSGKTTTGLSLLLAGWQLLSNDVVLLQAQPEGIFALPLPDVIGVRPFSRTLLPDLHAWLPTWSGQRPVSVAAYDLVNGRWAAPTPITAIYFPHIEDRERSACSPLPRAICLARLLEESVDQWDEALLDKHIALLQALSVQAQPFTLHLGPDVTAVPGLF